MAVPLVRRYNSALAVVGVPVNATDAITGETTLQLSNDNVIEDFVNSPDTAAGGDLIRTQLFINQLDLFQYRPKGENRFLIVLKQTQQ
jgi:hypothetical protein